MLNDPSPAAPPVGFKTTHTPKNPTTVPIHRFTSTFSFNTNLAKTRVNNGMVKFNVVTTAIGATVRPFAYKNIPIANKALRAKCKGNLSVLNESFPEINMTGNIVNVAKKNLKKTTCATDKVRPAAFIITSLATPII